ncbi:MAG TPA: hypothetical protein VKW06_04020 [Candidatus Angelobacter sp.]|nr:hypothetical protein [Candidatus Angelobacter sp.]
MFKKLFISLALLAAATAVWAQNDDDRIPDNKELISRARTVNVDTDTFFMKREALESALLGRKEFKAWGLRVTGRRDRADLLIHVQRVPFSNHFSYTVTDRTTETVVMAGKVDSLAGTVYDLIADEIVHKMKEFRGDPLAAQAAAPQAQP